MDNRTITFVIRMQNLAKEALRAFGGDIKAAAEATRQANAASSANNKTMRESAQAARQAGEAAQRMGASVSQGANRGGIGLKGLLMSAISLKAMLLTLGASASLGGALNEYIAFERKMSEFSAVTQTTGAALDAVAQKAQAMVAGTTYSATQAAEAMTIFARAGGTVEGSLTAAKAAIDGATVAGIDMSTMADITISTLNAFGFSADRAADAIDVLAKVDNISAADMRGLGEALSYSSTIANSAGVSFNTLAAALGVLGDAGTKGSRAGTEISNVVGSMVRVLPPAEAALKKLGLAAKDLNPQDIIGTMRKLRDAGMSTKDALVIFGEQGGRAATVLANNIDKIERYTKATQNAGGTAAEAAKIMKDNLGGDVERAMAKIKALGIELGEMGLAKAARIATQAVSGLIDKISDIIKFFKDGTPLAEALAAAFATLAVSLGVYAAASAIASAGLLGLAGSLLVATLAVADFTLALLANPFTFLIAGITMAVAAFVYFGNSVHEVNGVTVSGWTIMRASWAGVCAFFGASLDELGSAFSKTFNGIANMAKATGSLLASIAKGDVDGIKAAIADGSAGAKTMLEGLNLDIGKAGGAAFNKAYGDVIASAPNVMGDKVKNDLKGLNAFLAKNRPKGTGGNPKDTTFEPNSDINFGNNGSDPKANSGSKKREAEDPFPRQLDQLIKQLMPATQRVRDLKDNIALLDRAKKEGAISAATYAQAMGVLKDRASEESDAIGRTSEKLRQERQALGANIDERDLFTEIQRLDNDLRRDGLAYMQNGVLVMSKETQERRDSAIAMMRQNQAISDQDRLRENLARRAADATVELEAMKLSGYEKERYIAVQRTYNDALREYHGDAVLAAQAAAALGREMDQQRAAQQAAAADWQGGIKSGIEAWMEQVRDVSAAASNAITNALDGASDVLSQFVLTGKLKFGDFARSVIADISKIITKMLLMKAIQAAGTAIGIPIPTFHTGGRIGSGGSGTTNVDPSVFAFARRMHTGGRVWGLKADEVPIIAQTGERMLNRQETKAYEAGMMVGGVGSAGSTVTGGSFSFSSHNEINLGDRGGRGGGDGGGLNADNSRAMSRKLDEAVKETTLRVIQDEMRPGGLLARRNS